MILNLETEKAAGLDEAKLAADVMKLMGLSETCDGPLTYSSGYCLGCEARGDQIRRFGADNRIESIIPHPRVPKPLREVRDELIEWLWETHQVWLEVAFYGHVDNRHVVVLCVGLRQPAEAAFDALADFPLALALAAVRLLGEKQDEIKHSA